MTLKRFIAVLGTALLSIDVYFVGYFGGLSNAIPLPAWANGITVHQELQFSYGFSGVLVFVLLLMNCWNKAHYSLFPIFLLLCSIVPFWHILLQKRVFHFEEPAIRDVALHFWQLDWIALFLVGGMIVAITAHRKD